MDVPDACVRQSFPVVFGVSVADASVHVSVFVFPVPRRGSLVDIPRREIFPDAGSPMSFPFPKFPGVFPVAVFPFPRLREAS